MISLEQLSETATSKVFYEIVRTIYNNSEILSYVKSGKADYFGFSSEEELWEDRILFRPNKYAEFDCCINYLYSDNDKERAKRVTYVLLKLKSLFRDLDDEKILEQVQKFISSFTNNETY